MISGLDTLVIGNRDCSYKSHNLRAQWSKVRARVSIVCFLRGLLTRPSIPVSGDHHYDCHSHSEDQRGDDPLLQSPPNACPLFDNFAFGHFNFLSMSVTGWREGAGTARFAMKRLVVRRLRSLHGTSL